MTKKHYFATLANLIVPLAGMSTDIYLPSLPAINNHFEVTKTLAQLTVTAYALAMGLMQAVAGPISDAYGRKKLLVIAIMVQLFAVSAILYSPSIYWMICFRFIQGTGAALMIVPARAIINDIFTGNELKKQFNRLTISFALGPIIAPFIGGYLQHYFGWQANFYFILIYASVIAILLLSTYRETVATTYTFSIDQLWKNYQVILSNKYFIFTACFVGILLGYTAIFNIAGPYLIQTVLHQSSIIYGRVALSMGIAWFLGNTLNHFFFNINNKSKTQTALWLTFTTTIVMLFLNQLGYFTILTLAAPIFIIILLSASIFPIYVGGALTLHPSMAASANACLFSVVWLIFSLFTFLAAQLKINSLLPITLTYTLISILCLCGFYFLLQKLEKKDS